MKKQIYFLIGFLLFLTACSSSTPTSSKGIKELGGKKHISPAKIDKHSYQAKGQDERIKFIVLHYTVSTDEGNLKTLTTEKVSAHYLVTSVPSEPVYNLVDDHKRAWHAGVSEFAGRTNINDTSIGIEIASLAVNGSPAERKKFGFFLPYDYFIEYPEAQFQKVVSLVQDLSSKYNISAKHILAHSDIAPTRKMDPGPKFPWERLYKEYGLGAWFDEADKQAFLNDRATYEKASIASIKGEFKKYGYKANDTNLWDEDSRRLIYNFQAHFLPHNLTGNMDLETYATIKALNKKYR